jgi:hypothetical protein
MDIASDLKIPFILLTAGSGSTVKGVQIFSTAYGDERLSEEWTKETIKSLSVLRDACEVRLITSMGSTIYKKDVELTTVITDAKDLYNRMDMSIFAKNSEVVKTVNGLYPDEFGNVEVIEEEPEVVSSIEECVDITKKYVLPDGYIYAYRKKFVPGSTIPNFTNQLPIALDPITKEGPLNGTGYVYDKYYEVNSKTGVFYEKTEYGWDGEEDDPMSTRWSTGLIPLTRPADGSDPIVRVNSIGITSWSGTPFMLYVGATNGEDAYSRGVNRNSTLEQITLGGGKYSLNGSNYTATLSDLEVHMNEDFFWGFAYGEPIYVWFIIRDTTPPEDVIITVNEEITYTKTEDHYEWNWENTGKIYEKGEENPRLLPIVTETDNGKFLRVIEGKWALFDFPKAEEAEF